MLNQARKGFGNLGVAQAVVDSALVHLERWLQDPNTADYRPLIARLIQDGRWELLLDSFYQVIPFGTGGRRGPIGVGPNRINPYTIGSSVQGHAQYLRQRHEGELSVVIAYDVRHYQDLRKLYPKDVPNPVLGFTSRDFAELAAGVYAANGVRSTMLDRGDDSFISTPELSFAIRHLGTKGGLNVSASHNPPDDNGAKIYNQLGGQEIPPYEEELVDIVNTVTSVQRMDWLQAKEQGLVQILAPSVRQAYLDVNIAQARQSPSVASRGAKVVFTALHGTGDTTVVPVLRGAGFSCILEPTQAAHDGSFPNVPFGIPNPEVPQSMDRAVALAEREDADLVMACDPDADRLGLVVKHQGSWRFINGNELGALAAWIALSSPPSDNPIVMKSLVTSSLVNRVAQAKGAQFHGDLLVGFKYVAEALRCLEETGVYQHLKGSALDYTIGVEESHGVLVTSQIRDKDAAGAAVLLAEAASLLKVQGQTLVDLLNQIWVEVGYVSNRLISTVMRGASGKARIDAIQDSFRQDPPSEIGGRKVLKYTDLLDEAGPMGALVSNTDRSSRNVLIFELEGGRIILRPSGTEPKNKIYAELGSAPGGKLSTEIPLADAACQALAEDCATLMLGRVGLFLPRWALKVSDLVPVEQKLDLAQTLMPALVAKLSAGETDLNAWLDEKLADYGKDPRGLVSDAVRAYVKTEQPSCAAQLLALFA